MRSLNNDPSALLLHIFSRISGTEIQGSPGGKWPPQKFSVVAAVNLYSFPVLVFQNILCSYVYLVQFLPRAIKMHLSLVNKKELIRNGTFNQPKRPKIKKLSCPNPRAQK